MNRLGHCDRCDTEHFSFDGCQWECPTCERIVPLRSRHGSDRCSQCAYIERKRDRETKEDREAKETLERIHLELKRERRRESRRALMERRKREAALRAEAERVTKVRSEVLRAVRFGAGRFHEIVRWTGHSESDVENALVWLKQYGYIRGRSS